MLKINEPTPLQLKFSRLLPSVVLASSSPNRKKLLESGGSTVYTFSPEADESTDNLSIEEAMVKNARVKMEAYLSSPFFRQDTVAISADTLVHLDSYLLGKPKNLEDAERILRMLSGRTQEVLTGCGLYIPDRGTEFFLDRASVVFKTLKDSEIRDYLETGEWQGAAGAYRLQKTGWKLVETISGDWTTVVGLPLERIIERITR